MEQQVEGAYKTWTERYEVHMKVGLISIQKRSCSYSEVTGDTTNTLSLEYIFTCRLAINSWGIMGIRSNYFRRPITYFNPPFPHIFPTTLPYLKISAYFHGRSENQYDHLLLKRFFENRIFTPFWGQNYEISPHK